MSLTVGKIEFGPSGAYTHRTVPRSSARLSIPHEVRAGAGYAYVGTPYSKYRGGLEAAAKLAAQAAGRLMEEGLRAFSPIAHSHFVSVHGGIDPLDGALWEFQDGPLLDAAASLVVVQMEGWQESVGLAHEIGVFKARRKPIWFVQPSVLGLAEVTLP